MQKAFADLVWQVVTTISEHLANLQCQIWNLKLNAKRIILIAKPRKTHGTLYGRVAGSTIPRVCSAPRQLRIEEILPCLLARVE